MEARAKAIRVKRAKENKYDKALDRQAPFLLMAKSRHGWGRSNPNQAHMIYTP